MSHVGETVHYIHGGRCQAALIMEFYEEETIAKLLWLRDGGPFVVGRAEAGGKDDDLHFHALADCPDIKPAKAEKVAAAPAPAPKPKRPKAKPKG